MTTPDHDSECSADQQRFWQAWPSMPPIQTTSEAGPGSTVTFPPPGCICPPGANATCQAPACPRKPLPVGGAR